MSDPDAHLLIVDDDERIRGLLQKFLMRNGFLVSAARDAAHARRILSGLEFDMIILDVMMPGEDGVSLTSAIRETSKTPIMLLTAKGETEDRIKGLEAGADDYLGKPFEPKELLLRTLGTKSASFFSGIRRRMALILSSSSLGSNGLPR